MFCIDCGEKLDDGTKFYSKCGTKSEGIMYKHFLSLFVLLFAVMTAGAQDFDKTQFTTMIGYIGKQKEDIPPVFFDLVEWGKSDEFGAIIDEFNQYRYFSMMSETKGGGIFGIGSRSIDQIVLANADGVVTFASWEINGNSKQKLEEYRNIVFFVAQQWGKALNTTATFSLWKNENLIVCVTNEESGVTIAIFDNNDKGLGKRIIDTYFPEGL
jgi:hypothetical protein